MNWTDEELIAGCKRKSAKYEEVFYKKYYGYVMGISLSYSKDRSLADEIVNDSFMKFFGSVHKVEDFQSVKSWLRRITVNTAIDYFRKQRKYQNQTDISEEREVGHEVHALNDLAFQDIVNLINQLQDDHKMVFNLYEIEGYSHKEIADKLGLSESSSRVYLTRAKTHLRQLVSKHLNEYEGR
ncbi:RNA polymerase sigma factor [Algoriphagus halophytocola]|uniref:RNA polymerase sigma factor n=1 Tax=Algoriphagus halophytocola TaxID=2991499 RepID=A0ABY6MJ75_9BACT|nr:MULTISPECIES: RNA polymerase sigma factor [unclassified Algoriphagus]UZD23080.1 RNA polymerase sigma factor [Algoriphagus sp. TR-M5]WBL44372.1 RNA polymerase sigma factor [Algoriphagus sp. TR-M9]